MTAPNGKASQLQQQPTTSEQGNPMVIVTDNKSAPEAPPPAYEPGRASTSAAAGTPLVGPSAQQSYPYQTFQPQPRPPVGPGLDGAYANLRDPRDIGYSSSQYAGDLPQTGGYEPVGSKRLPGPGPQPVQSPQMMDQGRTVYYYRNPLNGATITSFLPPDHPRALCLQYGHIPLTTHGVLGILAAVFFFPIGVLCCLVDRRTICTRCGEVLSDGCS